mgnify:CR=1 FL=1
MKLGKLTVALATSALLVTGLFAADTDKKVPAFGNIMDVAYSELIWDKLEDKGLNSIPANLYVGGPPHGKVREVLEGTINGKKVIVKRNYGGKDVSIENVSNNRDKYLKAVTIMVAMEKGYDTKNSNWFWAKYKADGTLHTAPNGLKIAGKFPGCIACHSSASGNDLVFKHNKDANAEIVIVK